MVTAYAALVALGSDLTAADLMRMTPGIGADSIGQMMARLESGDQLRQANAAVLTQLRAQPIVSRWGQVLHASADMMSLEATRYLWSARIAQIGLRRLRYVETPDQPPALPLPGSGRNKAVLRSAMVETVFDRGRPVAQTALEQHDRRRPVALERRGAVRLVDQPRLCRPEGVIG